MNYLGDVLNKLPGIVLIIIAASCVITGDYFAKSWSVTHRQIFYVLALVAYLG